MGNIKKNLASNLEFLMSKSQDSKTLMQLRERSGVGYSTIRRMLSGEGNPTLDNLFAIAKHFKVDLHDLLYSSLSEGSEFSHLALQNIDLLEKNELNAVQNLIDTFTQNRLNKTIIGNKPLPRGSLTTQEMSKRKRAQDLANISQLDSIKSK